MIYGSHEAGIQESSLRGRTRPPGPESEDHVCEGRSPNCLIDRQAADVDAIAGGRGDRGGPWGRVR